jgi:hypothetical protein
MCGTITQARAFKVRATAFRKQQKVTKLSLKKFLLKNKDVRRSGQGILLTVINLPIRLVKTPGTTENGLHFKYRPFRFSYR